MKEHCLRRRRAARENRARADGPRDSRNPLRQRQQLERRNVARASALRLLHARLVVLQRRLAASTVPGAVQVIVIWPSLSVLYLVSFWRVAPARATGTTSTSTPWTGLPSR